MKVRALFLIACLLMTACNPSKPAAPNPQSAAHCMAAFNYARYWLAKGNDLKAELSAEAMAYYTAAKLIKSGEWDNAKDEAREITQNFAARPEKLDALYLACGQALEADREFIGNQRAWMRFARLKNEHCKQVPACRIAE